MSVETFGAARRLATELLQATGLNTARAERSGWAIAAADAWGIGSHGMMRLPHYLRRLQAGGCSTEAELKTVEDTGPLVSLDGQDGLGHWQLWEAAELAAQRCRQYGVALVSVGSTSHCGALGLYTQPVTDAGYMALVVGNGPAVMPPWEGDRPLLSTSPIAAGFPGRDGPAVVDLATSAVARGKIAQRAASGEALPPGWAFGPDGEPTTDPTVALRGMLAPLGGAKGFALAFMVEAMTGGLVGPELSTGVADMFDKDTSAIPQRISHLVIAVDPARTSPAGSPTDRLDSLYTSVTEAGGRVPGRRRTAPQDDTPVRIEASVLEELQQWQGRLRTDDRSTSRQASSEPLSGTGRRA